MRKNPNVHPLAQLTAVGRSLVESSVRNIGFASVGGASAAFLSTFDSFPGPLAAGAASMAMTIAITTISIGFVLYYIVPFLPFIYFFFAVGGWLKAIFEAMVGAPLWALAHIRIDGNGLPGAAAVNGYFLIFEIFLRPILIVFGLLASISIFAALVSILNQVWELVSANVSGFDVVSETTKTGPSMGNFFRSALDEFFFTVIYAIIVYMMALASFKMIDLIPANILRWMGQSVATENDAKENAAESLVGTAGVGGNQVFGAVGGTLKGAVEKMGQPRGGGG
jgi:conjugal transfer/type IV secretion protein DotA/TraY